MATIYALTCPARGGAIRYIGKARDAQDRFKAHLYNARRQYRANHNQCWLANLHNEGLKPSLLILCHVPLEMRWQVVERFFIASARYFGFPLTNSTVGGDGMEAPTDEVRLKLSESSKAKMANPLLRQRFLDARDEWNKKNSAIRSEQARKQFADPAARAALIKQSTDWNRAHRDETSARTKAQWSEPGSKLRSAAFTPEANAKRKAGVSAWANSPEGRAALARASRARHDKAAAAKAAKNQQLFY